jgi:hypothetical protein
VQLTRREPSVQLVEHTGSSDERDVATACCESTTDPAPDRASTKHGNACHASTLSMRARAMQLHEVMNALIKRPNNEKGAAGYALAWLLGIPIPILLLIFLIRGCD